MKSPLVLKRHSDFEGLWSDLVTLFSPSKLLTLTL